MTTDESVDVDVFAKFRPCCTRVRVSLWWVNVVACALHFTQAVLLFVFAGIKYGPGSAVPVSYSGLSGKPGGNATVMVTWEVFPFYPLFASAAFSLMSCLAHLCVLIWWQYYCETLIGQRRNWFRSVEYSLSASTMVVIIGAMVGVSDLYALICMAGCTVAMILFGDLSEMMMATEQARKKALWSKWYPFAYGSIVGTIPWVAIITAFFSSLVRAKSDAPIWLYFMIWGVFGQFMCFAMVHYLYLSSKNFAYEDGELWYAIFSITSKSSLAWFGFLGLGGL